MRTNIGKIAFVVAVGALGIAAGASAPDFSSVEATLQRFIGHRAFPGAAALVGTLDGRVLWSTAVGNQTYGVPAPESGGEVLPMTQDTMFDMASLTKVTATTTAAMILYQKGDLSLDGLVTDYLGAEYGQSGKGGVRIVNLLVHNAGYPPDPNPNYWFPAFGCPETTRMPHPLENFSCQNWTYQGLMTQGLVNPVGAKYVYSDLSMITMAYVIGHIARERGYVTYAEVRPGCDQGGGGGSICYYEAFVMKNIATPLGLESTMFLPPQGLWRNIAPTWNDTVYQRRVMQGTVSDGNAYAIGGISGHAGLFSTIHEAYRIVWNMYIGQVGIFGGLPASTVELFTSVYNITQSSRALGWDTNAVNNDYQGCADLSQKTFTHLGYTGGEICADPVNNIVTVLLDNRVYPDPNNEPLIHAARIAFNTEVVSALRLAGFEMKS